MKPYPEYKESGIEWLGEIPRYWKIIPLKRILKKNDGGVWGSDSLDNGTIVLRSTEITVDGKWDIKDPAIRELSRSDKKAAILKTGDLLVTKSSGSALHIGKSGYVNNDIANKECCYSNFMQRLRVNNNINPKFIYWILNCPPGRSQLVFLGTTTTGLANLSAKIIGDLIIALPELSEQHTIAAYLDRETSRIDTLIAKKQRQIELLQEKRSALISHVVTKGLPAEALAKAGLDPDIKMKDSGVEWLGEVPEHWEVRLFKRVMYSSYGISLELDRTLEGGTPIISLRNVLLDGNLELTDVPFINLEESEKDYYLLKKGDLLFNWRNGSSEHLGKTAYFKEDGIYTNVSFLLRLRFDNQKYDSRFYHRFLNGLRITGFFAKSKAGVNNTFNKSELDNLYVVVPPKNEQTEIADHLDFEIKRIDVLISKIYLSIEKLREYRTVLISAAVTGKINVRDEIEPAEQDEEVRIAAEPEREYHSGKSR